MPTISSIRGGEAGQITDSRREFKQLRGQRFVVIDRVPEDRTSGLTEVMFEQGFRYTFIWDHEDPQVRPLGKGDVEIKVTFECDSKTPTTKDTPEGSSAQGSAEVQT